MRKRGKKLRLYTLGALFTGAVLILWVRLFQIQILDHDYYSEQAKKQTIRIRTIPPVRGAILDREGRPLALSTRSYSVFVHPRKINGSTYAAARKVSKITGVPFPVVLGKMKSKSNFEYIIRKCDLSEKEVDALSKLRGVGVNVEAGRAYPYGDIANKIVGFYGYDDKGMAGIEAAYNDLLAGEPGKEMVLLDAYYREHEYVKYPKEKPVNGKSLVLTIDVAIQEIAETELERAVEIYGAERGTVIVMDCRTGEILALAEYPSARSRSAAERADSLWTIRSVTCIYEPGSTFKLITAAALLESGTAEPADVYYAEKGRWNMGPAVISDAHEHGYLTFREGFVFSSNIVMAKAAVQLDPWRFYKFIRLFGFGSKTGIGLPGESPGRVAAPEEWSERTQATLAFGQEIAVTPIQMIGSFAAVANGGVLMAPRIVKAVLDEDFSVEKRFRPLRIRRVLSRRTAATLLSFCRDVVREGTGMEASVDLLPVCGKTGTAQKASPRGGYLPGRYVASFIGFAPYEKPRMACLVLLDEPDYRYRFGALSAAPTFARIVRAVVNSTGYFDEVLVDRVVRAQEVYEGIRVPNLVRMDPARAKKLAEDMGLTVIGDDAGGRVVSQDPDPGVVVQRGDVVRIETSGAGGDRPGRVPDLRLLSLRQAKKMIVEAGFVPQVKGTGFVISQYPRPGTVSSSSLIRIRCSADAHGKK